jgi:hypothetical protein
MKLATVLILLMAMLQFIPPMFEGSEYFDNSYYTILFVLLSTLAISIPFLIERLPMYLKLVSFTLAGWYCSALSFEILNWFTPDVIINADVKSATFVRYSIFGTITLVLIVIRETWTKSNQNT